MMTTKKTGSKGPKLEEILRAYFLRAGFFVLRSVPFEVDGEGLTDIDLWLYERPTGTTRRRQIVDAKSKSKPKAVERLLWTKGLAEALDMDGAYVATTAKRPMIRRIARKLGVSILDGSDLQRIAASEKVYMPERLTDEELAELVRSVDKSRRNKEFQTQLHDVKSAIVERFGESAAVRAIDSVSYFANAAITAHPNSEPARIAGRLTYFSTSLVAVSLDFVGVEAPFRSAEDRRTMFVNAIRYGSTDKSEGLEKLRLATGIIRQYAVNGPALAKVVEQGFTRELDNIPAEIIADQVTRMGKNEGLFGVARELEHACYLRHCPTFDQLDTSAKAFLGALLDFGSVDRSKFATAWKASASETKRSEISEVTESATPKLGPLFERSS